MKVDRERRTMYQHIWKNYLRVKKKRATITNKKTLKNIKDLQYHKCNKFKGVESSYHIIIFYHT